jgi:hypothetical protein
MLGIGDLFCWFKQIAATSTARKESGMASLRGYTDFGLMMTVQPRLGRGLLALGASRRVYATAKPWLKAIRAQHEYT